MIAEEQLQAVIVEIEKEIEEAKKLASPADVAAAMES